MSGVNFNDTTVQASTTGGEGGTGIAEIFASANLGAFIAGNYYDAGLTCITGSTSATAQDRIELIPFYCHTTFSIDEIGLQCTTAVGGANAKVVIYSSDASGWPHEVLYESADLDSSSTGYIRVALTFTFTASTKYWVGHRASANGLAFRGIGNSDIRRLGRENATSTGIYYALRRTLTFATAATDPWVFTSTDLVTGSSTPAVIFKAS
jgi:hypothetical protein